MNTAMLMWCSWSTTLTADCCSILDFDEKTGYLLVEHRYPRQRTSEVHQAYVGVDNVLETTKKDTFVLGTWINVIGYVLERDRDIDTAAEPDRRPHTTPRHLPRVQAIMVWNAGAVHIEEYEKVIQKTIDLRIAREGK